jgi:hypothetical protein
MHFQYVVLIHDVQAPGKGNNMSASYRVGDVTAGVSHSHMHAIYEKGAWLVLESKRGEKRLTPIANVRDSEEESEETKEYRLGEAKRFKAQKDEVAA